MAGLTDVGRRRDHNEDAWGHDFAGEPGDPKGSIFAVSDGVGGQASGELASQRAIETLLEAYRSTEGGITEAMTVGFEEANRKVILEGQEDAPDDQSHRRRACTLVAAVISGDKLTVAHVGDSRAYLIRNGQIRQITVDHTLAMEWVRQGRMSVEDAVKTPQNNVITRAIGRDSDLGLEFFPVETLETGDRVLLCSDGLTKHVEMPEIAGMVDDDPSQAVQKLIDLANSRGGTDNITVVLIKYLGKAATAATMPMSVVANPPPRPSGPPAKTAKLPAIGRNSGSNHRRLMLGGAILAGIGAILCMGAAAAAAFGPLRPLIQPYVEAGQATVTAVPQATVASTAPPAPTATSTAAPTATPTETPAAAPAAAPAPAG